MKNIRKDQKGFTLIELMVAMAIAGAVLATMAMYYKSQQRASVTNQVVVDMQQNLRAAMYYISRDIRMAGYNPTREIDDADVGIVIAESNRIRITMDITGGECDGEDNDGDGDDTNWIFTDNLDCDTPGTDNDEDGDGDLDDSGEVIVYDLQPSGACPGGDNVMAIRRNSQPMACNIQRLNFVYLDADGNDLDADGDGVIATADYDDIRSVRITIEARPQDAAFMRDHGADARNVTLTTEVKCRNLGLGA